MVISKKSSTFARFFARQEWISRAKRASPGGGIGRRVRAIKKFKRKFDKTGVVKELRRRQQFDKPSELKRIKMAHAKYVQSLHAHDDM